MEQREAIRINSYYLLKIPRNTWGFIVYVSVIPLVEQRRWRREEAGTDTRFVKGDGNIDLRNGEYHESITHLS